MLGNAHALLLSQLRARALADEDYFALNVLSLSQARTVAELDVLTALAGRRVDTQGLPSLVTAGWVRSLPGAHFTLSDGGVRTMLELAAVARGVEEDALQQIDYSEAHVLKQLLERVIRSTAREVPALWPAAGGRRPRSDDRRLWPFA